MINPPDEPPRPAPIPGANTRPQPQRYQFSADEMRVLRECNKESFYGRCLPFASVLGGLAYYATKTGLLSKGPTFGAAPKVTVAVVIGYFLGKLSYHTKCSEKFMALPDSKIGRMIKARQLGIPDEEAEASLGGTFSINPLGSLTDVKDPKNYDYDSYRPSLQGLDDSFRPSMDNPIVLRDDDLPPEQKHVSTYDELRRKNRMEYESQQKVQNYRALQPPKKEEAEVQPPKNKYGDIWG